MKSAVPSYIIKQIVVMIFVNVGFILDGYTTAWTAPMIPKMTDPDDTPFSQPITNEQASWSASVLFLGSIACQISAYMANIIGRRPFFFVFGFLKILGYGVLVTTENLIMLYVGRFIVASAVFINMVNSLCYTGEITSSNIRGILLTSTIVCHSTGALLMYSIGPYVSYTTAQYIPIGIAIVYLVGITFVPESPLYYVIRGNEKAAKKILIQLGRYDDINKQLTDMSQEYKENKSKRHTWRDIFTVKSNRRSLLITTSAATFQVTCGVMYISLFATTIFENAASSIQPSLATICIGFTSVIGNSISPMFVEKFGRKILLITSSTGCCLTSMVLGIYFYALKWNPALIGLIAWLPLITLITFLFFYNIGLSSIPNTLLGELFNSNVRTLGSGIAALISTFIAFGCITASIYIGISVGNHVVFWLYSVVNIMAVFFTIFYVPETKGKSLMEIEEMLR